MTDDTNLWEKASEERERVLVGLLGEADKVVFHSPIPLFMGGNADVMVFSKYVQGTTYVTADLTGSDVGQVPGGIPSYEFMMITPAPSADAANLVSSLAQFSLQAAFNPGDTMDFPPLKGSKIVALFFTLPPTDCSYRIFGVECGILLCLGITGPELEYQQTHGSDALLNLLRQSSIYPYTNMSRTTASGISSPNSLLRLFKRKVGG